MSSSRNKEPTVDSFLDEVQGNQYLNAPSILSHATQPGLPLNSAVVHASTGPPHQGALDNFGVEGTIPDPLNPFSDNGLPDDGTLSEPTVGDSNVQPERDSRNNHYVGFSETLLDEQAGNPNTTSAAPGQAGSLQEQLPQQFHAGQASQARQSGPSVGLSRPATTAELIAVPNGGINSSSPARHGAVAQAVRDIQVAPGVINQSRPSTDGPSPANEGTEVTVPAVAATRRLDQDATPLVDTDPHSQTFEPANGFQSAARAPQVPIPVHQDRHIARSEDHGLSHNDQRSGGPAPGPSEDVLHLANQVTTSAQIQYRAFRRSSPPGLLGAIGSTPEHGEGGPGEPPRPSEPANMETCAQHLGNSNVRAPSQNQGLLSGPSGEGGQVQSSQNPGVTSAGIHLSVDERRGTSVPEVAFLRPRNTDYRTSDLPFRGVSASDIGGPIQAPPSARGQSGDGDAPDGVFDPNASTPRISSVVGGDADPPQQPTQQNDPNDVEGNGRARELSERTSSTQLNSNEDIVDDEDFGDDGLTQAKRQHREKNRVSSQKSRGRASEAEEELRNVLRNENCAMSMSKADLCLEGRRVLKTLKALIDQTSAQLSLSNERRQQTAVELASREPTRSSSSRPAPANELYLSQLSRLLHTVCHAHNWEYGELWLPSTGPTDSRLELVADQVLVNVVLTDGADRKRRRKSIANFAAMSLQYLKPGQPSLRDDGTPTQDFVTLAIADQRTRIWNIESPPAYQSQVFEREGLARQNSFKTVVCIPVVSNRGTPSRQIFGALCAFTFKSIDDGTKSELCHVSDTLSGHLAQLLAGGLGELSLVSALHSRSLQQQ